MINIPLIAASSDHEDVDNFVYTLPGGCYCHVVLLFLHLFHSFDKQEGACTWIH